MDFGRQNMLLWLPILFSCLNVFQLCAGVRCYQCQWMNGVGQRECLQSPPPSRFLMECNQPQCWKKYSHYNGNTNVQRYCVALASDRDSCYPSTFQDAFSGEMIPATECTCSSDSCNGASRHNYQFSGHYQGVMMTSLGMVVVSRIAAHELLR